MEYVFGTKDGIKVLKTKGSAHTNLTGFQQVEQKYPDQTIKDSFRIVRKLKSTEDCAGNCYDWYEIDQYYRTIDKTAPLLEQEIKNAANIDYLSMMSGIDLPGEEDAGNE